MKSGKTNIKHFFKLIIQFKYLNIKIFRFRFSGGININSITHEIYMNIRIVHTLRADWL